MGRGITLARVGGLSPVKQKGGRAPEKRGIWAFIWPNIELFLLSGYGPEGGVDYPSGASGRGSAIDDRLIEISKLLAAMPPGATERPQLEKEERQLEKEHQQVYRRPTRLTLLREKKMRLRKFQYEGLLWTRLQTGGRTLESKPGWRLVDAADLAKIARKTVAQEMGSAVGEGYPAGYAGMYSKDHWEVFVPANRGKITGKAAAERVAARWLAHPS